ncbi:MAG: DUF6134 family protein, partial [Caldimonas sp.]
MEAKTHRAARLRPCALALALLVVPAVLAAASAEPAPGEWNFQVQLDGRPIGQHRFVLEDEGEGRRLRSDARFDVKVLGFTAYRYRHAAVERWRGSCLASLAATTDDDGKPSEVRYAAQAGGPLLRVGVGALGPASIDGCVMSFAYWHPAIWAQSRLLNAQTGQLETVQVRRLADSTIEVHGTMVPAIGYRISGPAQPIDVWYAADNRRWIGLDSVVGERRKLSYRLR